MRNNEIRNILINLSYLEKEIKKEGVENNNIKYYFNTLYERIGYLLEDIESDINYINENIRKNKELIDYIKNESEEK